MSALIILIQPLFVSLNGVLNNNCHYNVHKCSDPSARKCIVIELKFSDPSARKYIVIELKCSDPSARKYIVTELKCSDPSARKYIVTELKFMHLFTIRYDKVTTSAK